MAQATATDITRIFGTSSGGTTAPTDPRKQQLAELQSRYGAPAPLPAGSTQAMQESTPYRQAVDQQLQQMKQQTLAGGSATSGSTLAPQPANQVSFPTPTPTLPPIDGGGPTPPSTSTFTRTGTSGGGGKAFQGSEAFPVDQELEDQLRARAEDGGLGTFQEYIESRFGPEAALIDDQFKDAEAKAAVDLARRGVMSSGEAAGTIITLRTKQGMQKASLLGILNSEYTGMQQQNINTALNQLGVLQDGKMRFVQGIRQSNIAAAATVQAASIQASATVSAASINANAGVQIAKIGAQASLQRANMDFSLATRQLDEKMAMQGIDPQRFNSDPVYRQDIIQNRAIIQNAKDMIYVTEAARNIEAI